MNILISGCNSSAPAGSRRPVSHTRHYPIQQDLYYACEAKRNFCEGHGKTIAMSTTEVVFTTEHVFRPRQRIRLNINWPVLLDDACTLKLQVFGSVIESEPGRAKVAIQRHQFRTGAIAPRQLPFVVPVQTARPAGVLMEFPEQAPILALRRSAAGGGDLA